MIFDYNVTMRELQKTQTFQVEAPGWDGAPMLFRRVAALLESGPDFTLLSINVEYASDVRLEDGRPVEVEDSDTWIAIVTVE